jgi:hypothetical protein
VSSWVWRPWIRVSPAGSSGCPPRSSFTSRAATPMHRTCGGSDAPCGGGRIRARGRHPVDQLLYRGASATADPTACVEPLRDPVARRLDLLLLQSRRGPRGRRRLGEERGSFAAEHLVVSCLPRWMSPPLAAVLR